MNGAENDTQTGSPLRIVSAQFHHVGSALGFTYGPDSADNWDGASQDCKYSNPYLVQ